MDKNSLRLHLRQLRRQIPKHQQTRASQAVLLRLSKHPWLKNANHVAFYAAADGELNPKFLLRWAQSVHKKAYMPCVDTKLTNLVFKRIKRSTRQKTNKYGIPEPQSMEVIAVQELDVILMPLVGFDGFGNRLGMGAGYYDRALENIRDTKTKLIGLAHACQQVPQLHAASWDIPLDAIATERGLIYPVKTRLPQGLR